jgi:uncharacterized protein
MQKSEQHGLIPGAAGALEAQWSQLENSQYWALICHPDPQQQGSMQNKVVTTLARSLQKQNINTLRFNFRGVGQSAGSYGNIQGEIDDALTALAFGQQQFQSQNYYLSGFSFGSYVAASLATRYPCQGLILVAPGVERFDFQALQQKLPTKTAIIQGLLDDIVSADAVHNWVKQCPNSPLYFPANQAGHFFHGQLLPLEKMIQSAMERFACQT